MKKIVCIVAVLISLLACSSKQVEEKSDTKSDTNKVVVTPYVGLYAIKKLDDGWYGSLSIIIPKNDKGSKQIKGNYELKNINSIYLDVINIKHQKLDGFYVPIKDEKGKETGKISTVMPSYVQSPQYGDTMSEIGDFLAKQKFTREIVVEDLKDLSLSIKGITKEDVVFLYNEAISKVPDKHDIVFSNIKEGNMGAVKLKNGDKLQFGYISKFPNLGDCNIEYILKDGSYLSDLVVQKKASKEQIALQAKLDAIEEHLVKTQDINKIESLGTNEYDKALKRVLKSTLGVEE